MSVYDIFGNKRKTYGKIPLNENRESKMRSKARNMAVSQGLSKEQASDLDQRILHDIPNSRIADFKFYPGVMRIVLSGELDSGSGILDFNNYLKIIGTDAHVNEYDSNLNGLSFSDIKSRFKTIRKQMTDSEKEESSGRVFDSESRYRIVRIPSFNDARRYAKYTDWCVTHDEDAYNSYTGNGVGLFYFCLHNGFENVPKIKGEGNPLDEYGLSMIAVSVNMDGSPNTITCRWNHENGANDSVMDYKDLEDILQMSFYNTFKPYTREELHAKGVVLFDEVQELLDGGKRPEDVFSRVGDFNEGYARVELNEKWNWIGTDGQLLSPNRWFDWCDDFSDGYARVELNEKWNWIGTDGKLFSPNRWFDWCGNFYDGYARVELNGKWNWIGTDGQLLSPNRWFDLIDDFIEIYARVNLDGKWNWIGTDGKLLSPNRWFDYVYDFHEGYAIVKLDGNCNWMCTDGKLLSPNQWFDFAGNFYGGHATVTLNGKYNFIGTDGKLISPNQWFDGIGDFHEGYSRVRLNGKCNWIGTDGKLLSPNQWFDWIGNFDGDYARLELNGKYNWIGTDGKLLSPNRWFDGSGDFNNGYADVELNRKWYAINTKGELCDKKTKQPIRTAVSESCNMVLLMTESELTDFMSECVKSVLSETSTKIRRNVRI